MVTLTNVSLHFLLCQGSFNSEEADGIVKEVTLIFNFMFFLFSSFQNHLFFLLFY